MVAPVSDGEPVKIATASGINGLIWHSNNSALIYSAKIDGTYQILSIASEGGKPNQLTSAERDNDVADVSKDGESILIGSAKEESNLWMVDVFSSKETAVASSMDSELWSSVSPDGKRIAFQSIKNLSQGKNLKQGSILVKTRASNAPPTKLTESGFLPTWSPDGQYLAFMRPDGSKSEIWVVKETGGREKKLTSGEIPLVGYSVSPYNRVQSKDYSWSADSRSIAYISERNGFSNVWVVDTRGSGDTQVTNNKDKNLRLYCPVWSSSGSKIAYFSKTKKPNSNGKTIRRFWTIDTESKSEMKITEMDSAFRLIGWSENDRGLIVASPSKNFSALPPETKIGEVNIETGERKPIADLKNIYFYNINLSPDKKTIAYVSHEDGKRQRLAY